MLYHLYVDVQLNLVRLKKKSILLSTPLDTLPLYPFRLRLY